MSLCLWCGSKATRLCDEALAMVWDQSFTQARVTSMEAMLSGSYTCDAPMCVRCATGVGFVCGTPDVTDTIDHCPFHIEYPSPLHSPMTLEDIDTMRRSIHATVRRQAMKRGHPHRGGEV